MNRFLEILRYKVHSEMIDLEIVIVLDGFWFPVVSYIAHLLMLDVEFHF